MQVLLIDNGTTLLHQLRALIPGEESVIRSDVFSDTDASTADLIVLSGSSVGPLFENESLYQKELDFILTTDKPVIGICFGHELIVHALGGKLKKLPRQEQGTINIRVLREPELFNGRDSFDAYENHRYGISTLPDEFEILAESDHSPEVIRHTGRRLYGLQFHPENHVETTFGSELFLNIFNKLTC